MFDRRDNIMVLELLARSSERSLPTIGTANVYFGLIRTDNLVPMGISPVMVTKFKLTPGPAMRFGEL